MNDSIIRKSDKTENYTIVFNECFKRDDLSARAKGIFGYIITLPNDWVIYRKELYTHFTEGREALDTAFNELIKAGYIVSEKIKSAGKFDGIRYTMYEESVNGKPDAGKPFTENPLLLSTNLVLSTNKPIISVPSKQETKNDEQFSIFYQNYPKKTDKTDAKKAFNVLIKKGTTLETILSALTVYQKRITQDRTETKYIRSPARFLHTIEDFEDEKPVQSVYTLKPAVPCKCGGTIKQGVCASCGTIYGPDGKEVNI